MFLDFSKIKNLNLENEIYKKINKYKSNYINYFNRNKFLKRKAKMHDPNPKLIVTIYFKAEYVNILSEQNFPISSIEWEQFQKEEKYKCRKSCEIWVVDGNKYTVPS